MSVVCPLCHCQAAHSLGSIPKAFHFCETKYTSPINAGVLMHCPACSLRWRHPLPDPTRLLRLYQTTTSASTWTNTGDQRVDFQLVAREIRSRDCRTVMEIGCFAGSLSRMLQRQREEPQIEWFGIEPSAQAATVARHNGVTVIAGSIDEPQVRDYYQRFDAVVAIDVFEHLVDLQSFFREAVRLLKPFGLLIVTTGAIDAIASNRQGSWNYVAMPEHMVFMSMKLATYLADSFGLRLLKYERFRHRPVSVRQALRSMGSSALSAVLQPLPWSSLSPCLRKRRGVGWISVATRDHCFVCWEREDCPNSLRKHGQHSE